MLDYSEFKKGVRIIIEEQPYEIIEANFLFKARGGSGLQTKIKNLITGSTISRTFRPGESFEEADIIKTKAKFLYSHRDNLFFCQEQNPSSRFELPKEIIGSSFQFLKPNEIVEAMELKGKIVNVSLPIKVNLKVIESPPGLKGDRSQMGNKQITLETGAKINAPLFIKEGDIIEINTETAEYVRRIE